MSGTRPHFISMTDMRESGATILTSAPLAICRPPPKHTPCTAAITGMGNWRQPMATAWNRLALPCVRSASFFAAPGESLSPAPIALISRPAQKALPSPDSTTTRTDLSTASVRCASTIPSNMSRSRAFILSARFKRTSATWFSTVILTRSVMARPCTKKFRDRSLIPVAQWRNLFDPPTSGSGRSGRGWAPR